MDDVSTYSCVGPIEVGLALAARLSPVAEHECPFVNGSETRCAEHLTMGGMSYAYDHCFAAAYQSCPAYRQLAAEAEIAVASGVENWRPARSKSVEITVRRKGA